MHQGEIQTRLRETTPSFGSTRLTGVGNRREFDRQIASRIKRLPGLLRLAVRHR